MNHVNHRTAFTLIELMVVVSIIIILTAILIPSLAKAREYAKTCHELAALRQVNTVYMMYAQENDNRVLPGMMGISKIVENLIDDQGTTISKTAMFGHQAERWPWRLFNYAGQQSMNLVKALYIGERYQALFVLNQDKRTSDINMWHYISSQSPSFGMNMFNLGGYITGSNVSPSQNGENGPGCVTKTTEAKNPGSFISFASVRSGIVEGTGNSVWTISAYGKKYNEGNDRIECPSRQTYSSMAGSWNDPTLWSTDQYDENKDGSNWGNVHPRCGGKAAVAFLDGHVETMTINQLRDNKLWINQP